MCDVHTVLVPTVEPYFNEKRAELVHPQLPGFYPHFLAKTTTLGQYQTTILGPANTSYLIKATMADLPGADAPLVMPISSCRQTIKSKTSAAFSPHHLNFRYTPTVPPKCWPPQESKGHPYHILLLSEVQQWIPPQDFLATAKGRSINHQQTNLHNLLGKLTYQSQGILKPVLDTLLSKKNSPIQKHWNLGKVWVGILVNNPTESPTLYLGRYNKDNMPGSLKEAPLQAVSTRPRALQNFHSRRLAQHPTPDYFCAHNALSEIHDRPGFVQTHEESGQLDFTSGILGHIPQNNSRLRNNLIEYPQQLQESAQAKAEPTAQNQHELNLIEAAR